MRRWLITRALFIPVVFVGAHLLNMWAYIALIFVIVVALIIGDKIDRRQEEKSAKDSGNRVA